MPRRSRKKSATDIYHVVIKGIDRQLMFEAPSDYKKYIETLEYYKEECHFTLYAYCLMSNHVHLLIQVTDTPLENVFRKINTYYSGWFNAKYDRTGPLQEGRYYSEPIESLASILNAIHYIHFNPLKAGLETALGESYPWNSYQDYMHKKFGLLDEDTIFRIYGTKENFLYHHQTEPTTEFIDIGRLKKRLPDDVAKEIIATVTGCTTATQFQLLSIVNRNKAIVDIHKKGVSVRQLNRLTGIPRGIINRVVAKEQNYNF